MHIIEINIAIVVLAGIGGIFLMFLNFGRCHACKRRIWRWQQRRGNKWYGLDSHGVCQVMYWHKICPSQKLKMKSHKLRPVKRVKISGERMAKS